MKRKTSQSPISFFQIHASIFAMFTIWFWLGILLNISDGRSMSAASASMFVAVRLLINLMWGAAVFYHYRIHQQISLQQQDAYQKHFEEFEKIKREHKAVLDLEAEAADGTLIDEDEWRAQHRSQSK